MRTIKHPTGALAWLPSQCALCHAWPSQSLCADCWARFAPDVHRCVTCAIALPAGPNQCGTCLRHPPPLTHCATFADYAYPWDLWVTRLKFHDDSAYAANMAKWMLQVSAIAQMIEQANHVWALPLSNERLRERGYNQAALLAAQLSSRKSRHNALVRIRHSPPQASSSRVERLRQLKHAFMVEPSQIGSVQGQHIVLIDDVMTSGATVFEAARTLLQAGASRVDAAIFARTPNH
jgi:ComF family protein